MNYDAEAYCDFHQMVSHNCGECMHLKNEVQNLIKKGKITPVNRSQSNMDDDPLIDHEAMMPPSNNNFINYSTEEFNPDAYFPFVL